jgi:hypothetical protein
MSRFISESLKKTHDFDSPSRRICDSTTSEFQSKGFETQMHSHTTNQSLSQLGRQSHSLFDERHYSASATAEVSAAQGLTDVAEQNRICGLFQAK